MMLRVFLALVAALALLSFLAAGEAPAQSPRAAKCRADGFTFVPGSGGGRCDYSKPLAPAPVPVKAAAVPPPDPWAIDPPRVTSQAIRTAAQVGYTGGKNVISNVHVAQASDAWPQRYASTFAMADIRADSVKSVVDQYKSTPVTITGARIDRLEAKCWKRCFLIRGASSDWIIRHARLSGPTGETEFGAAIAITDSAHDLLFENVEVAGFRSSTPKEYPNADGIVSERGNYNVTARNVTVRDVTDGCFDLKSRNNLLDNIRVSTCRYGVRAWTGATVTTMACTNAGIACIWSGDASAVTTVAMFRPVGSQPFVHFNAAGIVDLKACDLSGWTGKVKQLGKGTLKLGPGC